MTTNCVVPLQPLIRIDYSLQVHQEYLVVSILNEMKMDLKTFQR